MRHFRSSTPTCRPFCGAFDVTVTQDFRPYYNLDRIAVLPARKKQNERVGQLIDWRSKCRLYSYLFAFGHRSTGAKFFYSKIKTKIEYQFVLHILNLFTII